jgi:hypothetical protein
MNHQEFAEKASERLEAIAETTREEELRIGHGITSMRANELMVAARLVRDLSEAATRKEARRSQGRIQPSEGPS